MEHEEHHEGHDGHAGHSGAMPHEEAPMHAHEMAAHTSPEEHAGHEGHPMAMPKEEAQMHAHDMAAQTVPEEHATHAGMEHGAEDHKAHADHTGHEQMFQRRFWVSLALSIPVLLYSPMVQELLGFSMPAFPGSQWITPLFSVVVFLYGGVPFLQMAVPELRNRQPGMMTLISLAISVAFVYSLAALFLPNQGSFFWELVTLIDIMLLGHWLEMRSVRQASGALNELAKLMPDTAERVREDGSLEEVPAARLRKPHRRPR